jgi:hypothetical protein
MNAMAHMEALNRIKIDMTTQLVHDVLNRARATWVSLSISQAGDSDTRNIGSSLRLVKTIFKGGKDTKNVKSKGDTVDYVVSISESLITTINCFLTKWMMHKCQNRRKTITLKEPPPCFRVLSLELRKQAISAYHDHAANIRLAAFHH